MKPLCNTGSSALLCDDLDGWEGEVGRRIKRGGIYVYLQEIPVVVELYIIKLYSNKNK